MRTTVLPLYTRKSLEVKCASDTGCRPDGELVSQKLLEGVTNAGDQEMNERRIHTLIETISHIIVASILQQGQQQSQYSALLLSVFSLMSEPNLVLILDMKTFIYHVI